MLRSTVDRSRRGSKVYSVLAAAALLLTILITPAYAFTNAPSSIFVNGIRVDTVPITKNGTTYLPIQVMAQALQAEIVWDAKLNSVKVNGKFVSASVVNDSGRIYLPAESFISAMGGTVNFDGRNNRVLISTAGIDASKPAADTAAAAAKTEDTAQKQIAVNTPAVKAPAPAKTVQTAPAARTSSPIPAARQTNVQTPQLPSQVTVKTAQTTVQPGYPAAYAPNQAETQGFLRHVDGNNYLPSNLQAGPVQGISSNLMTGGSAGQPSNAQRTTGGSVYVPKHAQNSVFQVTVTNLETISVLKDFYKPRQGYKYVIAYLSQQNVSQQVQVYTGRFSLLDQKAVSYDYIEGLSNFWLVILRPYGVNFGYLVFEIPADSKPVSLVLHSLNQAPLAVNL